MRATGLLFLGSDWLAAADPSVAVANLAPGSSSYTNALLAFSTQYCCRLASVQASGSVKYSNLACGVTAAERNDRLSLGISSRDADVSLSAFSSNAPDTPMLNSPANGATGVSTSPILSVNVSDPDEAA